MQPSAALDLAGRVQLGCSTAMEDRPAARMQQGRVNQYKSPSMERSSSPCAWCGCGGHRATVATESTSDPLTQARSPALQIAHALAVPGALHLCLKYTWSMEHGGAG
ncbi:hypothetical protein ZWY2020_022202 [Hordeum vulgare]|nr:hypothetical protein ZWY2020_022202 [Hordeum vulgare]